MCFFCFVLFDCFEGPKDEIRWQVQKNNVRYVTNVTSYGFYVEHFRRICQTVTGILWGPGIPHESVHMGRIMKGTFITREDRTNLAQSLFLDTVKTGTQWEETQLRLVPCNGWLYDILCHEQSSNTLIMSETAQTDFFHPDHYSRKISFRRGSSSHLGISLGSFQSVQRWWPTETSTSKQLSASQPIFLLCFCLCLLYIKL